MRTDPVDALLDDILLSDPERHQLMLSLRRLILSVDPAITHTVKYGGLLFSAGSPFCGLFSYQRHVSLEFSRGADLADPHAVLEGDGKKRRHIKIHRRDEVFKKNVRDYVERARAAAGRRQGRSAGARATLTAAPMSGLPVSLSRGKAIFTLQGPTAASRCRGR